MLSASSISDQKMDFLRHGSFGKNEMKSFVSSASEDKGSLKSFHSNESETILYYVNKATQAN